MLFRSLTKERLTTSVVLEIYALPTDFTIAGFDYNVYICRNTQLEPSYLILTLPSEIFDNIDYEVLIEELKGFINFEAGQIFKLSNIESPQIYACKANNPSVFKTLEVIYEF